MGRDQRIPRPSNKAAQSQLLEGCGLAEAAPDEPSRGPTDVRSLLHLLRTPCKTFHIWFKHV